MELTDNELEKIRTVARDIEYGSVVIHMAADSPKIDIEVNHRIRLEREPTKHRDPMPKRGAKGYRD